MKCIQIFEWKNLKGPLGKITRRREDIRLDLREIWWKVWNEFIWLITGTSGTSL
jgi:hypothetical protein